MKAVFLALLFALPNGQVIRGNNAPEAGWSDMPMASMKECRSRAKSMYAKNFHETQKPKWAKSMVVYCKVVIK